MGLTRQERAFNDMLKACRFATKILNSKEVDNPDSVFAVIETLERAINKAEGE